ncbi:hypothetical protein ZIOFF_010323 [Zingiber officinale]|uniref:Methyltransferase n=1 Tax=Zingiber officinale TaxID=94328 RepID=A0A8J5HPA0_ZINOF|nr:hypothetical protein ZIOFF_010323 [Zingiber officinale]
MSFAPKEHKAQIHFSLERGIPAFLSMIVTQKLAFPNNVFDLIHCARCRVHRDEDAVKSMDSLSIGVVTYQKPISNLCYMEREENHPPLCSEKKRDGISWYVPLDSCLPRISVGSTDIQDSWPPSWPKRLNTG